MTNVVKTPHVHAALIKQWADGAEIQWYNNVTDKWEPTGCHAPCWDKTTRYRVKPEPKPVVVLYAMIAKEKDPFDNGVKIVGVRANQQLLSTDTCMFVFDGETGKLKDCQILAKE